MIVRPRGRSSLCVSVLLSMYMYTKYNNTYYPLCQVSSEVCASGTRQAEQGTPFEGLSDAPPARTWSSLLTLELFGTGVDRESHVRTTKCRDWTRGDSSAAGVLSFGGVRRQNEASGRDAESDCVELHRPAFLCIHILNIPTLFGGGRATRQLFSFRPGWHVVLVKNPPESFLDETRDGLPGLVEGNVAGPLRKSLGDRNGKGFSFSFPCSLGADASVFVWGRGIIELLLAWHGRFVL